MIAIISFVKDDSERVVHIESFEGDYLFGDGTRCWAGFALEDLEGLDAKRFFDTLLTHHHDASNKRVVTVTLNTWFWVAVLGQDGQMRGRPKLIRHTLPNGSSARWALVLDERHQGARRRYRLEKPAVGGINEKHI